MSSLGIGVPVPKMLREPVPPAVTRDQLTQCCSNHRHLDSPLRRISSLPVQPCRIQAHSKGEVHGYVADAAKFSTA